jgi:RND family efflux transporter MFP subunit
MTRRARWLAYTLGITLALLGGCEADPEPAISSAPRLDPTAAASPTPTLTSPILPTPAPAPAMLGVLVPEAEVMLVASGFARLERLELEIGDHVRAGEVVAEMDVRGDRTEQVAAGAAWRAATAELERLELELEQARVTRGELEQLEDFVAKAELRERRFAEQLAAARKRSAGASLVQHRSKVDEAEARLDEAKLRAPFDGVVARRHVDPGATLTAGEPVVELMSDARLVRFAVPETQLDALALGARVCVVFEREAIELHAEVSSIAPQIEAGTRLVIVEAAIAPSPALARLRVGAIARVRFE